MVALFMFLVYAISGLAGFVIAFGIVALVVEFCRYFKLKQNNKRRKLYINGSHFN